MTGTIRQKEAKNNYKYQLFGSFFVVSVLALTIMISISFSWFQNYIYKEIKNLAKSQLDNINTSYQMYMEQYRKEIYTMYQNPGILSFLYSHDSSDFTSEYNVSRYLQTILSNDVSIDYILLFHGDEIIMNTGREFPSSKDLLSVVQTAKKTTNDDQNFFLTYKKNKQLAMIQTERKSLYGESQNGIIMVINLQKMQDKFISKQENSTDAIYILNDEGKSIVERNINVNITGSELWKYIKIDTPGYFSYKTSIEANKYIGNYLVNDDPRYAVLTLQDIQSSEAEVYATKRLMIFVSIVLLAFISIVSFILTKALYKPLDRFWSKINSNSALILPGENMAEIKKIDTTIDRIIERVTILSQQHSQDEVIKYLHDDQKETAMPLILELQNRNEQAILSFCNIITNNRVGPDNLIEAFKETLIDEFPGCKIYIFNENSKSFLVLIKELIRVNSFENREEVKKRFNRVIEKNEVRFHVHYHIALSETITDDLEIERSYRHLENYLRYHLLGELPGIIDKEYVEQNLDESVTPKIIDKIMYYIREGNAREATQELNPLFEELNKYKIKRVMLFLAEFTTNLNNLSNEFSVNSREYKEHYLENYLKILSINNREELTLWMAQLVTNTCLELRVAKEKTLRTNMIKSIKYIQNNYLDRNISVEALADQFHISTSYFSKLFKEYTGTTFPEYVNDLRLNLAKDFIINNPSVSIKKISDQIGFSSDSYFSAQFKKKFGMSPSQYRNNL